jgi:hypothetical protein
LSDAAIEIVEAARLPELWRRVCGRAGVPLPPAATGAHFVFRSGAEPAEFLAKLLEEAVVDDEAEVRVLAGDEAASPVGDVAVLSVKPGFASACPAEGRLRAAVAGRGATLLVAVERYDLQGRLAGVTWAALPEQEPSPQGVFRAALLAEEM